jgi:hypothetical protein
MRRNFRLQWVGWGCRRGNDSGVAVKTGSDKSHVPWKDTFSFACHWNNSAILTTRQGPFSS